MAGAKCARCGCASNLQLDHVDPTTKVDHKIWSWSKARLEIEFAKCQWLCSPCHSKKSLDERGVTRKADADHGTRGRYDAGCRCETCRAGYARIRKSYQRRASPS